MTGTDEAVGAADPWGNGSDLSPAGAAGPGRPALFGGGAPGAPRPRSLTLTGSAAGPVIRVEDAAGLGLLVLGPFAEEEVIATWRSLGASSGLALSVAGADGIAVHRDEQIGRLKLGRTRARRRLAVLNGRRPRFLARRKHARLPRCPLIHRERELVAGGDR